MGANLYSHTIPASSTSTPNIFLIYHGDNLSRPTPNLPTLPRLPCPTYTYIVTVLSNKSVLNVFRPYNPTLTHHVFTYSESWYF